MKYLFLLFFGVCNVAFASEVFVYIYNDEGVSEKAPLAIKKAFQWVHDFKYDFKDIKANEIISGEWKKNAFCLIMPGGADLYYCKKLKGKGNEQIKDYVSKGGKYIGLCAGGYYGGSYVEFDKGGTLEVLGERELKFFPGKVKGPVLANYVYESEKGARVATVSWKEARQSQEYSVYFNGGGYFVNAQKIPTVKVLATYKNSRFEGLPAIVECTVGEGKAILTGVHPETSEEHLQEVCHKKSGGWENVQNNILPIIQENSHKNLFKKIVGRFKS